MNRLPDLDWTTLFFGFLILINAEFIFSNSTPIVMTDSMVPAPEILLADFTRRDNAVPWRSLDDRVMGGVSQSRLEQGDSSATYRGTVSLENNGGFASLVFGKGVYRLKDYDGILLRLKGGGKRYGFRIVSPMVAMLGDAHYAYFQTEREVWQEIRLPFKSFVPMRYGITLPKFIPINKDSVQAFGFIIEDKQAGAFQMEIAWVKAYRSP